MHARTPSKRFRPLWQALLAVLFFTLNGWASAAAPQAMNQAPGFYRLMVGTFEVTALYDGAIELDTKLLQNATEKEIRSLLARMFVKGPAVQTAVNAYLINTGSKLVLVDAGAAKLFGPTLGHITDNLKASGYAPEQVDVVLLTHLHGDHVNGLVTDDGKPAFTNAEIWSARADNEFWLSEEVAAAAAESDRPFFKMAREAAAPYQASGKWNVFSTDREIVPGVASVAAHGHTPGHSAYLIGSDGEQLLIWGDIVHNHAVQFARPQVAIEFDVDRKQAIAARRHLFARASKEKLLVGGMHLPFPGIGHVRKEQKGYAWVPIEFAPLER